MSPAAKPALRIPLRVPMGLGPKSAARLERLGVQAWTMRVPTDKGISITSPMAINHDGTRTIYGITYKGRHYDCGHLGIHVEKAILGIEIAAGIVAGTPEHPRRILTDEEREQVRAEAKALIDAGASDNKAASEVSMRWGIGAHTVKRILHPGYDQLDSTPERNA